MRGEGGEGGAERAWLRGLVLVLGFVLIYCAIHVGFRLLASSVLGEDDVVEAVLAQEFRVAYDAFPRQPPLYNWVLYALQGLVGLGIETFLLIKYVALTAVAVLIYLVAYRAYQDRLFAVLSVESLALIYQIAWRYHEGFTHEVLAMVAVMATLYVLVLIVAQPSLPRVVALGLCVGMGLLSEPTYYVFLTALIIAAVLQPSIRTQLFRPSLLVSLVVAAAIAAPYWLWVFDSPTRVVSWMALIQPFSDGLSERVWAAVRGPFAYLSPLILILPIMFPGFLKTVWADLRTRPNKTECPDIEQLSLHCGLAALGLSIAGAMLVGISGPAIHVLMPLYLPTVIWLFGAARRSSPTPLQIGRFTRLALAITVIAFVARMANMFIQGPVCKTCRWGIPYAGLAEAITARGFDGTGTLVTVDKETAGNLRVLFPDAAVVTRPYPRFMPDSANLSSDDLVVLWPEKRKLPESFPERYLTPVLPEGVELMSAERIAVPWHHLWRESGYRESTWRVIVVDRP